MLHLQKCFWDKERKDNNYHNVTHKFHCKGKKKKGDAHNICNLKFGVSKEISVFFQNNMNYHYHFIIKELSKEFERDLTCLEEHNEKYITFSVRITVKT